MTIAPTVVINLVNVWDKGRHMSLPVDAKDHCFAVDHKLTDPGFRGSLTDPGIASCAVAGGCRSYIATGIIKSSQFVPA